MARDLLGPFGEEGITLPANQAATATTPTSTCCRCHPATTRKRFQSRVDAAPAAGDDVPPAHTSSGVGSSEVISPPHPPPCTSGSSNSRRRRQRRSVCLAAMADAVRVILAGLGEDVRRDGLLKTPSRVARALDFAVQGYEKPIAKVMTSALFPEEGVCEKAAASGSGGNAGYAPDAEHVWLSSRDDGVGVVVGGGGGGGHGGLVVVRDIRCFATCAGCLLPLRLRCHVGYVPACGRVVGLSKLARVAVLLARRLQTPDGIASALAGAVESALRPGGVAVVVEAQHLVGLEERTTGVARACGGLDGWGSGERVTGPVVGLEGEEFDKDGGAMHTAGAVGGAGGAVAASDAAAVGSACGRPVGKDEGGFRRSMRCSCTSLDELDAHGSADEWLDVGEESDSALTGDDGEGDEHFRGWARPGKEGHHMACSVSGIFTGGVASSGCGGLGLDEVGSSSSSSGSGSSSTTSSSNSGHLGPELDEFLCLLGLEWVDCCEKCQMSSTFVEEVNSSISQGPCPLAVNSSTLSRLVPPSWGDDGQEEERNDDTAGDTHSEEEEGDKHGPCYESSHISASAATAAEGAAGVGEDGTFGPMKGEGALDDAAAVKAPSAASVSEAAESLLGWCLAGRVQTRKQTAAAAADAMVAAEGAMVAAELGCNGALEQSGFHVVAGRYLNYLLSATAGSLLPLQYVFGPGHLCQRSECRLRAGVDDVAGGIASLPPVQAAGAGGNDAADVARWLTGGGVVGRGPACGAGGSRGVSSTQGLRTVLGVPMSSLCEHHLLPFFGHVHVAWVPLQPSSPPSPSSASSSRSCSRSPSPSLSSSSSSGTDAVLVEAAACEAACEAAGQQQQHQEQPSRMQIARAVQMYGRRPQVQERLTRQVAEAVEHLLKQQQQQQHRHHHHPPCSLTMEDDPNSVERGDQDLSLREGGPRAGDLVAPLCARWGVMVVVEAEHLCMAVRGVEKPGAFTSTLATLGAFATEPRLRAQFLRQVSRWRGSLGANTGSGGW